MTPTQFRQFLDDLAQGQAPSGCKARTLTVTQFRALQHRTHRPCRSRKAPTSTSNTSTTTNTSR